MKLSEKGEKERVEIQLDQIPAVSPSLAEVLRNCPLQALLSQQKALRPFILGNPKAWLGIAYHEVLEKLWSVSKPDFDDEQWINFLWNKAIERISSAVKSHPLDCRFADPEKWPGYHLTFALLRSRAREALAEQPRLREKGEGPDSLRPLAREQTLSAMNGKLVGKPDIVIGDEIRDYKSGKVTDESADGRQSVKKSYIRQLRLYGYLVQENGGKSPNKGTLLPMLGAPIEIELTPAKCLAEANEAIRLLDSTNVAIESGSTAAQIATASADACFRCNHQSHCSPFWNEVDVSWWGDTNTVAVAGRLTEPPIAIHGGKSFALRIDASAGNVNLVQFLIGPFERKIHGNIENYAVGDQIRITGCYRRRDDQLTTTPWTLCCRESECPEVLPLELPSA